MDGNNQYQPFQKHTKRSYRDDVGYSLFTESYKPQQYLQRYLRGSTSGNTKKLAIKLEEGDKTVPIKKMFRISKKFKTSLANMAKSHLYKKIPKLAGHGGTCPYSQLLGRLRQKNCLNPGGRGCSEPRPYTAAWVTDQDFIPHSTKKNKMANMSTEDCRKVHFGRSKWVYHLRPGVQDQPSQHDEAQSTKKTTLARHALWEAEAGGSRGQEFTTSLANMVKAGHCRRQQNSCRELQYGQAQWLTPVYNPSTLEAEAVSKLEKLQFFCFETESRSCCPGWAAMERSQLTATSIHLLETGFHHVDQTGLEHQTSGDSPASASQSDRITVMSRQAQSKV
ncbi:hypothetical protein AAY473_006826 [Plecturocebus cupreus]